MLRPLLCLAVSLCAASATRDGDHAKTLSKTSSKTIDEKVINERIRRRLNTESFEGTLSIVAPLLPINGTDETLYDHADHDEIVFLDPECAHNVTYADFLRQRLLEDEDGCFVANQFQPNALSSDAYFYFYLQWNTDAAEDCADGVAIDFEAFCIAKIEFEPVFTLTTAEPTARPTFFEPTVSPTREPTADPTTSAYQCEPTEISGDYGTWYFGAIQGDDPTVGFGYNVPRFGQDNVIVYVIDSYVNLDHEQFSHLSDDNKHQEDFGTPNARHWLDHGTHVAALIVGKDVGIMRDDDISLKTCAVLVPADERATGADNTMHQSMLDKCLRLVIADLDEERSKDSMKRGVINLSLGGENIGCRIELLNVLFRTIKAVGGIVVVAAGNDDTDACNVFPACSDEVVTVGSYDDGPNRYRSYFSCYGDCVDAWAPGLDILSASIGDNAYSVKYGTSMASPIMAGMIGQLLNINNSLSTDNVKSIISDVENGVEVADCKSRVCSAFSVGCEDLGEVAGGSRSSTYSPAMGDGYYLSRRNDGEWGHWRGADYCPQGQYARGFRIRSEWPVGNGDDTAANAVKLYCSSPGWSYDNQYCPSAGDPTCTMAGNFEGYWGDWCGSGAQCPSGEFMVGFDQKVEADQDKGDDTALNDIAGLCSDGTVIKPACNQAEYGRWGSWTEIKHYQYEQQWWGGLVLKEYVINAGPNFASCVSGSRICGLDQKVEGHIGGGDDTALNAVHMFCCEADDAPPLSAKASAIMRNLEDDRESEHSVPTTIVVSWPVMAVAVSLVLLLLLNLSRMGCSCVRTANPKYAHVAAECDSEDFTDNEAINVDAGI